MGRRKRSYRQVSFVDGSRSSIGDAHVAYADIKLDRATLRETALTVPRFDVKQIMNWFFDDAVLHKLRQVDGLVIPDTYRRQYLVASPHVLLAIDFSDTDVPTPTPAAFKPNMARCEPMLEAIRECQRIHSKYQRVRTMLHWFNRNATPGAIRNYWPCVLQLCGDAPSMKELQNAPARYDTPKGIGEMLPLIRETSATMAAMELIPANVEPRLYGSIQLNLREHSEHWDDFIIPHKTLTINL